MYNTRYLDDVTRNFSVPVERGRVSIRESVAARSGEIWPGRAQCRPNMRFTLERDGARERGDLCAKHYDSAATHTLGLFSSQCLCRFPKKLGIAVMRENEYTATALSAILARFPLLPENCFYDNACSLSRSIVLRFPTIVKSTRILCDRYHYRSHSCPSVFDPDSYVPCDRLATSGAEALNSRLAVSRNHIRFLSGRNLVPFLMAKVIFLNLRAMIRRRVGRSDIEDVYVNMHAKDMIKCTCERCSYEQTYPTLPH